MHFFAIFAAKSKSEFMPKSKNSDVRIKVIDRCLCAKNRKYTTAEMFDLCNKELENRGYDPITALNSIRNDILQIETNYPGATVKSIREERNIYYHYADPDFSIYKSPLRPEEKVQLIQTLQLMKRFKGMPQFDWITEISDRLSTSLKIDEAPEEEVVGFDENLDLEGMKHFTPLFNAIVEHQPLKLTYKSFKQEEKTVYTVHPYYLKQYNKRWFLFAWNADESFLANYAFDRIVKIKNADVPYRRNDIDFFDFFDDMIGVSKDTRTTPQKVKLLVSPSLWPYVKTKPLHGTQHTVKIGEEGTVITIEVYLNYELEQLLLSFGEKVKVLAPQELKDKIKQRLVEATNNYLG